MDRLFKFIKYVWQDLVNNIAFMSTLFTLISVACILIPCYVAYYFGGKDGIVLLIKLVVITIVIAFIIIGLKELRDYILNIWRMTK